MSLNLDDIIKQPAHRYRAFNALAGLTAVFIRCALVLMGGQNHRAAGIELLTIAALAWLLFITPYLAGLKVGGLLRSSHYRTVVGSVFYIAEIVGSSMLISGSSSGLYVVAVAMLANLSFMISAAWLLLAGVSRNN
jgi:hypothetical protein